MTHQESMMKEMKDLILKGNEESLDKEKARANRDAESIESSIEELSVSIRDEVNTQSQRNLEELLEEMQEQKASNEIFRKSCKEALLKTKSVQKGIEQEIRNTKAGTNSKAVAGLINTSGAVRDIKQNISDTSAGGGSFAGAGIMHGLDLSIPSSKDEQR